MSTSHKNPRGFTLIELLVVMAIMVIISAFILFRQTGFDSSTLLRSLAYSVALSVRQAQVYGTSVLGTSASVANCAGGETQSGVCFAPGYGIYINWGNGNPTSYILFADLNDNGTYDPGEEVQVYNLGQGYSISKICATTGGSIPTQYCSNNGGLNVTWMSIVFRRPNPEACFATNDIVGSESASCAKDAVPTYATAYIQIQSDTDSSSTHGIFLNSTGEISVGETGT